MFLWNCFSIGSAVHNTLFCHWSCRRVVFLRHCSTIGPEVKRFSTIGPAVNQGSWYAVLLYITLVHQGVHRHCSIIGPAVPAKFLWRCSTIGPEIQQCSIVGHSVPAKFSRHCSKLILYFSSIAYTVCTELLMILQFSNIFEIPWQGGICHHGIIFYSFPGVQQKYSCIQNQWWLYFRKNEQSLFPQWRNKQTLGGGGGKITKKICTVCQDIQFCTYSKVLTTLSEMF